MGMTIAEKIIAAAAGVDSVKPGDIHTVKLDRLMSNDGTTHLTVDMYNNKLKNPHIADTSKLVFIVDHNVPSDSPKTAASQKKMRDFAKEHNIDFWEGKGVCHQVMIENYVRPGELIFGADSHTCSYGALGAFGTGVGCTDFLYGMVTGTSWVLVPESVKFNLTGKLPEGVYARDLILTIIGEIGANGCNYQAMEFTGEGAKTLSISDRMALCNMAVEAGAKTGIFEADEKAIEYLKEHGREPKAVYHSDPDAVYAREYTFDLSKVRPVVAKPDFVDNVVPAEEARGIEINEAFLGSCNNGRIEDLRVGAEIIKGKKVAEGVRFLVVPASQTIYRQALKEGLIDTFMEAGAIVMNPNCSVCWGSCQGVIGENEVLISTGTRNFKGRAGHPSSKVYLGSAATGAKTLSISDRMALCNMAVEAGAKTGIFEADEKAIEYLKEHGREPKAVYHSDPDAVYAREYTFDLSKVRPVVAKPDFVDNVVPAEEARGIEINEAFLGSCNNGRIEDLRVGAEIIKGKKVAEGVRFLVVPASQTIYRQALKEGLIDTFMEAGAIVMNPNCSVCWGSCQGVIGENEVLISTGTRNFKGRAGHPSSKVYLGSAATVTASAITGKIALASEV